ncbi:MAG: hypothetical protein QXP04_01180 [Candidatus Nanoarchaeia archaeon]|nr:hypothetical protein [Candidatus Jingweiarchaeum tengchongense]
MSNIPEELQKKIEADLNRISNITRLSIDTVRQCFEMIFNSDYVQKDPTFTSIEDRVYYSIGATQARLCAQPPTEEYLIVPFGITDIRITTKGEQSRIYALVKGKGFEKFVPAPILCRGEKADLVNNIKLFYAYKTRLAKFFENVYMATSQTTLENSEIVNADPIQVIITHTGAKMITLAQAPLMPSRKIGGYVDELDLRIIRCYIVRWNTGKRQSGTDWAVYTVTDGTVENVGTTPDGKIIPPTMTVWVPKLFLRYDVESEVYVVGTISFAENEPFMNAIYVHPIHSIYIRGRVGE